MAVLAATGRPPWEQDENKSHDGGPRGWVQATDAQKVEAIAAAMGLELEDLHDGRRMRRVNHVIQLVAFFERLAHAQNITSGLVRRQQLVAALWPGEADKAKLKRCSKQLKTWERIAYEAGLLRVWDARGDRGLRWELLGNGATLTASRGYSSVGRAAQVNRRAESRRERHELRHAPSRRTVGNRTQRSPEVRRGRLVLSLRFGRKSHPSGLGGAPKGPPPQATGLDVCLRRGAEADATGPRPDLGRRATPDWEGGDLGDHTAQPPSRPALGAASEPGRGTGSSEEWGGRIAERFAEAFGGPAGQVAGLVHELVRYQRASDRLAKVNGWKPNPDRALERLLAEISSEADRRGVKNQPPLRAVAWFVPRVKGWVTHDQRRARRRELELAGHPQPKPAGPPPAEGEPPAPKRRRPAAPGQNAKDWEGRGPRPGESLEQWRVRWRAQAKSDRASAEPSDGGSRG